MDCLRHWDAVALERYTTYSCMLGRAVLTQRQSHTILGTKTQRGLVQMTLDVIYQTCEEQLVQSFYGAPAFSSLATADVSDAQMYTATAYLDNMFGDNQSERFPSRAQTPMQVWISIHMYQCKKAHLCHRIVVFSQRAVTGNRARSRDHQCYLRLPPSATYRSQQIRP